MTHTITHILFFIYSLIGYCIYEFYKYYQYKQRLSRIKQIRMPDANNEKMTKLYLEKILNDKFFFKQLGLFVAKKTKNLTYYELSMILNSFIFGRYRKISETTQKEYDIIISQIEKKYGIEFTRSDDKSFNGVPGLCTYDISYKPQIMILVIIGLRQIFNLYVKYLDYDIYYDNITHIKFIRNKINDEKKPYYLFIHGFGIGLINYYNLLLKFKDFNIIFMEIPNISSIYEFEYYDDRFMIIGLENYLRQNKIKKLNVIAHSYGGFISQKLYNLNKELFNKFYLIESPCLMSLMPQSVYLFNKNNVKNVPLLYKLFIFTDINVFLQVGRTDTSLNQYVNSELYDRIYMFFATKDIIVNYNIAKKEIKKYNIKFLLYDGHHSNGIINDKILDQIIDIIKKDE